MLVERFADLHQHERACRVSLRIEMMLTELGGSGEQRMQSRSAGAMSARIEELRPPTVDEVSETKSVLAGECQKWNTDVKGREVGDRDEDSLSE